MLTGKNNSNDKCAIYRKYKILYTCELVVIFMMVTISVKKEKPTFVSKPTDLEITIGEDAHFEATVGGKPEPTVEWYVYFLNKLMSFDIHT